MPSANVCSLFAMRYGAEEACSLDLRLLERRAPAYCPTALL